MTTFLTIIHVIACVVLIILVLIQRGRGAGLVESFAGVESMFGTKTNAFLTRTTTIMSIVFFITCLSLALLSVRQGKSLITDTRAKKPKQSAAAVLPKAGVDTAAKPAETKTVSVTDKPGVPATLNSKSVETSTPKAQAVAPAPVKQEAEKKAK
ncbi:MAG: preprotein translocase subunit SecG [Candidatus Omnitrophica bacterium]|jgi:preprotein translocase subunit SecG|nr:preprotein translocase subunit SecG [Candidatus Omnitrophota bacterium]